MLKNNLNKVLRFCFTADHSNTVISLSEQVRIAVKSGATIIRYRNDSFTAGYYNEIKKIDPNLKNEKGLRGNDLAPGRRWMNSL